MDSSERFATLDNANLCVIRSCVGRTYLLGLSPFVVGDQILRCSHYIRRRTVIHPQLVVRERNVEWFLWVDDVLRSTAAPFKYSLIVVSDDRESRLRAITDAFDQCEIQWVDVLKFVDENMIVLRCGVISDHTIYRYSEFIQVGNVLLVVKCHQAVGWQRGGRVQPKSIERVEDLGLKAFVHDIFRGVAMDEASALERINDCTFEVCVHSVVC